MILAICQFADGRYKSTTRVDADDLIYLPFGTQPGGEPNDFQRVIADLHLRQFARVSQIREESNDGACPIWLYREKPDYPIWTGAQLNAQYERVEKQSTELMLLADTLRILARSAS